MALEYNVMWNIKEDYKDLIQKEKYEVVLLNIMNSSKIVFSKTYNHIKNQANGESDYITTDGEEYLDAKVIFYQEQCIAIKFNKINDFLDEIQIETNQLFQLIMNNDLDKLKESKLFLEIYDRIEKMKEHENLILFFPFDITGELHNSLTSNFGSDVFSQIIYKIDELYPEKVFNMKIYMIYPNIENKIVLKRYEQGKMIIEFLNGDFLKKYIECIHVNKK